MYGFIFNMWVLSRVDEIKVALYVTKRFITPAEVNKIVATPQHPEVTL